MRLSANISTMFGELPFLERFAAARRAGFAAVEVQYPYGHPVADIEVARRDAGIPLILLNAPKGRNAQDRGLACLPGREREFRDSIDTALSYTAALGNRFIHVLSGVPDVGGGRESAVATWLENMDWAAREAAQADAEILVEALNPLDVSGYFIRSLDDAIDLIRSLGKTRIGLLFDVYHCATAGEPVVTRFHDCMPLTRHVQIADAPGRAEPGSGEIDWSEVFATIESSGYRGHVGAEYTPAGGTIEGLAWARPYLEKP